MSPVSCMQMVNLLFDGNVASQLLKPQLKTCLQTHCCPGNDVFLHLTQWHQCKELLVCSTNQHLSAQPHPSSILGIYQGKYWLGGKISFGNFGWKCTQAFQESPHKHQHGQKHDFNCRRGGLNKSKECLLTCSSIYKLSTNNIPLPANEEFNDTTVPQ